MSRWKSAVLHEGEGNIRSVKWRGHLIAWANNMVDAQFLSSERLPSGKGWSERKREGMVSSKKTDVMCHGHF